MLNIIEKGFFEGYASSDLNFDSMLMCIIFTTVISLFVYYIYKLVNRNVFYNKNFNLSLVALSIITSAIILTIQSNIVVSLGMVGALSIVRFRTAIKDTLDLIFLFWSISIGIICGAGYAIIAVMASIVLAIIIVIFEIMPSNRESVLLTIDCSIDMESMIDNIVKEYCDSSIIRARSATKESLNIVIEIKTNRSNELINKLISNNNVYQASIVEHNGDITL